VAGSHPETLAIALVVGGAVSVVFGLAVIPRRFLKLGATSPRQIVRLWLASYSFGMVGAAAQLLRADVAIVTAVAGPYAGGVYAAPARLFTFLTVLPSSFSVALFSRVASAHGDLSVRRQALVLGGVVVGILSVALLVLGATARTVVPVVLGAGYSSSADVLRIYLVVILLNAANQPLLALLQA